MAFKVDNQTINDLKMVGDHKGNDVYSLYNRTKTQGGAKILKDMFLYPRSRAEEINNRIHIIKYLRDHRVIFPFENQTFDAIEFYLSDVDERTKLSLSNDNFRRKFNSVIGSDFQFKQLYKGILETFNFLVALKSFISVLETENPDLASQNDIKALKTILSQMEFDFLSTAKHTKSLSFKSTVNYDILFRFSIRKELLKLLHHIYYIDVYTAVAAVAREKHFEFAEIDTGTSNIIEIKGVYHPLVPNAVANDITIDENNNLVFLTGANMAGKSTFMKTFSIAVYMAHMGFPQAIKKMRFSLQKGMFTTINLADNLNIGLSHFYSEVSRVKKVAESVKNDERLIVVFDELFRGTNVKDAYDATIAVTDAFAEKPKCTFIISTHIIEAAEALKKLRSNIKYVYLPTVMNAKIPEYTYKISEGVSNDRHGMVIIKNEKVLDILGYDN